MEGDWWEWRAALDLADRAYTLAWHKAMRLLDREPDLRIAMKRYNQVMERAFSEWQREISAANALKEGVPF